MSLKPAHENIDHRQLIWEALKTFAAPCSRADLRQCTKVAPSTISNYLIALVAGVVEKTEVDGAPLYRLLRDTGYHAPRLKADGTPVKAGGSTLNIWRSMRSLKQFSARELAAHSTTSALEVSENHAKVYCSHLLAAGYLRVIQKAAPPTRAAIYRLIRDTGPVPPKTQRVHQVFDPNTGQVHPRRGWSMNDPVETARAAWGDALPDWVAALARECAVSSQSKVAARMGRSPALVSQVLRNSYGADLGGVEQVFRGVFESLTFVCPALGPIGANVCRDWQLKSQTFVNVNSLRVRMYRACHACPRLKGGKP